MAINPEKFKDVKILVVGDIMLDEYVSGKCHRVSPEAPVPVILNPETEYVLGGAGNVLANVLSLEHRPKYSLLSATMTPGSR